MNQTAKHTSRYFAATVKNSTIHTAINMKGYREQITTINSPPLEHALKHADTRAAQNLITYEQETRQEIDRQIK